MHWDSSNVMFDQIYIIQAHITISYLGDVAIIKLCYFAHWTCSPIYNNLITYSKTPGTYCACSDFYYGSKQGNYWNPIVFVLMMMIWA